MLRQPKGQYVRDTWDWLGSDAGWGYGTRLVTASQPGMLYLKNESQAGEYMDVRWVYATTDQPAPFTLVVASAFALQGTIGGTTLSNLNPNEGMPPAEVRRASLALSNIFNLHVTPGNLTEFYWPKIGFGNFVRVPPTWGLGVGIVAGAADTNLAVTFYFQFITETDIHTGAAAPARSAR